MKRQFLIFNRKAVVRTFWQMAAIALLTTVAASSSLARDAQSRLPYSKSKAGKVGIGATTLASGCQVTNPNFSKKGNEYGGTATIKLSTDQGGNYSVQATIYGNMGQHHCSVDKYVSKYFSVGDNVVNVSLLCKPKSQTGTTWNTFSITLWQSQSKKGYKCYPEKMPIKKAIFKKKTYKKLQ